MKCDDINVLLCSWRGKDDGKWGERHPAALTFVGARNGLKDLTRRCQLALSWKDIVESLVLRFLDIIA